MLGDISPQSIKITSQAVVYPGRSHVTVLNVKRFDGRKYSAVDLNLLTRAVLVFPQTSPVIVYDSATAPAGTITWAGSDITIDLSDFSMPASVQSSHLIVYDAEHLNGQVLVDDNDSVLEFDFRNVNVEGVIQPPVMGFVSSVNGLTGAVNLAAVYAPLSHVGAGGAAHANVIAAGAAGFMTGADKSKLDGVQAGAQVNVGTNIAQGTRTTTTVPVTSSTGTGATLDAATASLAGVMTAADKTKLDGVATGANNYVHPNHTGDVTSTGDGAQVISANAVTNAKLADVATATIKGRVTAATGDPEDLTAAQVRTLINVADGANNYAHPNHTGDVTSTGDGAQVIAANAVTNTKAADMAVSTIKGRITAGTGDPEDLTAAQVRTVINVADGATANSTDTFLLARANHTGEQAISTITGLQTALDKALYAPVITEATTARVLALTDGAAYIRHTNIGASTVTVPPQSSVAWSADTETHIRRAAAGNLTLTPGAGVTLNAPSGGTLVMTDRMSVTLKRVGTDVWDVIGQTVAV